MVRILCTTHIPSVLFTLKVNEMLCKILVRFSEACVLGGRSVPTNPPSFATTTITTIITAAAASFRLPSSP
ncbi:hypothetical protein E2C01_072398 [Portunus trituberculatus]|uniref:Uncharacterized protein n=1 Tax=Portunus trituberculatus TaxID=210409 RepID=A0A5B7I7R1_PORTR|nr:hypothetical protein [Portunus trituberculatus]